MNTTERIGLENWDTSYTPSASIEKARQERALREVQAIIEASRRYNSWPQRLVRFMGMDR